MAILENEINTCISQGAYYYFDAIFVPAQEYYYLVLVAIAKCSYHFTEHPTYTKTALQQKIISKIILLQ